MQAGFRAYCSCSDADMFMRMVADKMEEWGGEVWAASLDLKKAFDTVNHNKLISKLSSINFSTLTLKWIESYLFNRSQYVRVQNNRETASAFRGICGRWQVLPASATEAATPWYLWQVYATATTCRGK